MADDESKSNAPPQWTLDLESGGTVVANGAVDESGRIGAGGEMHPVPKPLIRSGSKEGSGSWFGLLRNSSTPSRAGQDEGLVAATEHELVWHAFGGGSAPGLLSTTGEGGGVEEEPVAVRRKYMNLKRTHSTLWEFWNREGSGRHHMTAAEIMAAETGGKTMWT